MRYIDIKMNHPLNALLLKHAENNRANGVRSPGSDHEPIISPPQNKFNPGISIMNHVLPVNGAPVLAPRKLSLGEKLFGKRGNL